MRLRRFKPGELLHVYPPLQQAPGATTSGRSFKAGRFVLRSDLLIPGDIQQGFAAAP